MFLVLNYTVFANSKDDLVNPGVAFLEFFEGVLGPIFSRQV